MLNNYETLAMSDQLSVNNALTIFKSRNRLTPPTQQIKRNRASLIVYRFHTRSCVHVFDRFLTTVGYRRSHLLQPTKSISAYRSRSFSVSILRAIWSSRWISITNGQSHVFDGFSTRHMLPPRGIGPPTRLFTILRYSVLGIFKQHLFESTRTSSRMFEYSIQRLSYFYISLRLILFNYQ